MFFSCSSYAQGKRATFHEKEGKMKVIEKIVIEKIVIEKIAVKKRKGSSQSNSSSVTSIFRFATSRVATVHFPESTPAHSPGFIIGVPSIILTPASWV